MRRPAADLHVHTTASDGVLSGRQVVEEAASLGLAAVAITDHDALGSIEPALDAARGGGVDVIAGVELSASDERVADGEARSPLAPGEIHVLGYFIDPGNPDLRETVARIASHRQERILAMVEGLCRAGIRVSGAEALAEAGDGVPGRPHLARVLVRAGYAGSVGEAFQRYLVPGRPGFVGRYKLTPSEACRVIRGAGGVPVLAHPGLISPGPSPARLREWGIAGLEVRHPRHSPWFSCRLHRFARVHGFLCTGGSDFHGPGEEHGPLGSETVPLEWVERLRSVEGCW